jgi:hypothetical protein
MRSLCGSTTLHFTRRREKLMTLMTSPTLWQSCRKAGAENYEEYGLLEREKPENCILVHSEYDRPCTESTELMPGTED